MIHIFIRKLGHKLCDNSQITGFAITSASTGVADYLRGIISKFRKFARLIWDFDRFSHPRPRFKFNRIPRVFRALEISSSIPVSLTSLNIINCMEHEIVIRSVGYIWLMVQPACTRAEICITAVNQHFATAGIRTHKSLYIFKMHVIRYN